MRIFKGILLHECMKVWKNKKFLMFLTSMLFLNVFALWYSTLSDDYTPSTFSYIKLENKLSNLKDEEKIKYIEKYVDDLSEDSKLQYTENYMKETTLLNQTLDEVKTVVNYNEFLDKIQNQASLLSGVSIFNSSSGNEFSDKNIVKTAKDYKKMVGVSPTYENSKGIEVATQFQITDILIILSICVIIYVLVFYEKEKNLTSIIRVTNYGRLCTGICKLLSFEISCIFLCILFYGENLIYSFARLPMPNLWSLIQSMSPFVTSTLDVSIGIYLLIYFIGKAVGFMVIGNIMFLIALYSNYVFLPYLVTGFMIMISYVMSNLIEATSNLAVFKYFNLIGILDINKVFGSYLNINIFNEPVNYRDFWLIFTSVGLIILSILIVTSYCKMRNTSVKSISFKGKCFKPHTSLFVHEAYKILIMKKGIMIIVLFILGSGYFYSNHDYYLSGGELTYKEYMNKLEGPLSREKEVFLKKEKKKYKEAIRKTEEIEDMYNNEEITMLESMNLKEKYERILINYPIFEKVWKKYEFVKENPESEFVYDSGYKLLFNTKDNSMKVAVILYFATIIFTMSSVFPMEYSNSQYKLLRPTLVGVKKINYVKIGISSILAILIMIITLGSRFIHICKYYELNNMGAKSISLLGTEFWGSQISIGLLLAIIYIGLLLFSLVVMGIILSISKKMKNSIYTIVISCVVIVAFSMIL